MHPLSPAQWDQMRHSGDPLADAVARGLIERGWRGSDSWGEARRLAAAGDEQAAAFVVSMEQTPDWVDRDRLAAGQALFLRQAPLAMTAFVLGTLPITYAPEGSARVLHHTGRLAADVRRRLFETAVMVREVLRPDAFDADGPGRRAIARVRLLHATVRQRVLMSKRWDSSVQGLPINQLELGLTACGFSGRVLHGLERLGVRFAEGEREAYQQLWRFANQLQGIEPALLPAGLKQEQALYLQYREQLMRIGDEGRALVASLHGALAGAPPFWLPLPALQALSRRLIDDEGLCDAFGIPRRRGLGAACGAVAAGISLGQWRFAFPALRRSAARRGQRFFVRTIEQGLQSIEADFQYAQRTGAPAADIAPNG